MDHNIMSEAMLYAIYRNMCNVLETDTSALCAPMRHDLFMALAEEFPTDATLCLEMAAYFPDRTAPDNSSGATGAGK